MKEHSKLTMLQRFLTSLLFCCNLFGECHF